MLFLSPLMNSTWLGPGSEIAQSLHRGRAISFFKDNPRRHPRNRQHWSHAYSRAETHQGLNGLNCRVRLFRHSKTNLGPDFLVRVTAFERRRMLIVVFRHPDDTSPESPSGTPVLLFEISR